MKLVVVGHGPGAISLASHNRKIWEEEECEISILELKKGRINPNVNIKWPDGNSTSLEGCNITCDPEKVIPDASIILFCNPLNSYPGALKEISNYVTDSLQLLCGVPGATGFDWMVKEAFVGKKRNFTVGAIESLPFIAKKETENEVKVLAVKHQLHFASQPSTLNPQPSMTF